MTALTASECHPSSALLQLGRACLADAFPCCTYQAADFGWSLHIPRCCRVMPIMGAGYHSIHHTTYQHNYGHYFIYCDWLFGTLHTPAKEAEQEALQQLQQQEQPLSKQLQAH